MAKLSAHGTIIGKIRLLTFEKAYMSDGHILQNNGQGWRLYKKIKDGISPIEVYKKQKEKVDRVLLDNPCLADYRKKLHSLAGVNKAYKLHIAIQLMPDDPDGVWSEVCDGYGDNIHAGIDEVSDLCSAYKAYKTESESKHVEV